MASQNISERRYQVNNALSKIIWNMEARRDRGQLPASSIAALSALKQEWKARHGTR